MNKFLLPSINLFGNQAIESLSSYIEKTSITKCLIITDEFLVTTEAYRRVIKVLSVCRVGFKTFDQTMPNPTDQHVDSAYQLITGDQCGLIISLGGGSAHDLSKAVGIVATHEKKIHDYEGADKLVNPIIPLICINTTSGTGSEVTRFTIITDSSRHVKMAIIDDYVVPWISVNDIDTLITMPRSLTSSTGMDALTHAIESFLSINATPLTDSYALEAIRLISSNLYEAYQSGENRTARENMAMAQFLAGVAFSNASLGYVHGIAHQLGGIYNLPHGLCNAVLLPVILAEIGKSLSGDRLRHIYNAFGYQSVSTKNKYIYHSLIRILNDMNKKMDIPNKLSDLGIQLQDIPLIASNTLLDPCIATSPVQFTYEELVSILKKSL